MVLIKNRSLRLFLICSLYSLNLQAKALISQSTSHASSLSNFISNTGSTINNGINSFLQQKLPTSDFMNPNGTQITTNNPDKSQTINYFDVHGKNIARTEIDPRGSTNSFLKFNSDGTQIKTKYNSDNSQTIDYFDVHGKNSSRTEIDARGSITLQITLNADGSQVTTAINADKTQTINYFNAHEKNIKRVEIGLHGKPTKTIDFNDDTTQAITTHHTDNSQTIDLIDLQGHRISKTFISNNGIKTSASTKLLTAWHEAGHALSRIHNDSLSLVQHVTIQPDTLTNSNGHVISVQTYQTNLSTDELEAQIISALCGAVAEQILMSENMILNSQAILLFFTDPRYATDMQLAYKDAKEIITIQSFQQMNEKQVQQKIDEIIIKLYKKAYQFLATHKHEIKKIAESLMQKNTLTSDETYNLINADKPLMSYEQGPLPLSLVGDYKYRGWQVAHN